MRCFFVTFMMLLLAAVTPVAVTSEVDIMGDSCLDADALTAFVARNNPSFNPEIARAFIEVGRRYGIRGDIALCQAILETGWFRFGGGTAVTPDQHNYCGLGVTRGGLRGATFADIAEGVTAMMQHLYAYSSREALPDGETLVDPRFGLVTRGCATTWEGLSNRWAMNPDYGRRILSIYERALALSGREMTVTTERREVVIPADTIAESPSRVLADIATPSADIHPDTLAARDIVLRRLGVIP